MEAPRTLIEAVTYYADPERAHAAATKLRWPHGIACPRPGCGSASVRAIPSASLWHCRDCNRRFSAKVGTIFEDSPIPFTKWLPALWLLTNTKNGTSSHELGRAIGVTQKTAWFMFHRIRLAMKDATVSPLVGEVEADETYVGGKGRATIYRPAAGRKVMAGGPHAGKTIVLGMAERGDEATGKPSRVRAKVVPNVKRSSLLPFTRENVEPGSILYTDALRSYRGLEPEYAHAFVDHMTTYVNGRVHTNTIENFWSCLKRTIKRDLHCAASVPHGSLR